MPAFFILHPSFHLPLLHEFHTPRVFVAPRGQNDGKTTISLGLLAALQRFIRASATSSRGPAFVEIEEQKIDEDTVLMDAVFRLKLPAGGHESHRVEPNSRASICSRRTA